MTLPINPETKVSALLDAYPGIEDTLIALAPPFEKLRNPVLRKTVAKLATLEQAAKIGGLSVRELVTALRKAAGQEELPGCEAAAAGAGPRPDWVTVCSVQHEIDGEELLAAGVHPIGKVRECAGSLEPGRTVRLATPFRPEPLIETMRRAGLEVWSEEVAPGRHATWFSRRP